MNVLDMTADRVLKVMGDPAVYVAAPFLEPMRSSAMAVASRFRGCKNCQRPSLRRAAQAVGGAFAKLASEADPALLPALRAAIFDILRVRDAARVIISYTDDSGAKRELVF